MKSFVWFLMLVFSSLSSEPFAFAQTNPVATTTAPDALIENLGQTFIKDPQSVGLSIGFYYNGASHFYDFGTTEKGKASAPTKNTVYEIGSITKVFVSLVLANAVTEKKVRLDDDIRKYLVGSYTNLEYDGKGIKLVDLANTTSGIPNWLPVTPDAIKNAPPESVPNLREKIYGSYQRKDFFDALHAVKLDTAPGLKSRHSNAAAQLLGFILEDVYAAPLENLVARYVSDPLKMSSTTFLASKTDLNRLAKGCDDKGRMMPHFAASYLQAAGGLNSCTADLVEFIKFQLGKENDAVNLSHAKTLDAGSYEIALNWLIYKHENGLRQMWTDGGTYGFCSYLVFYPELNSGIILLANESDDSTPNKLGGIAFEVFKEIGRK